MQCTFLFLLEVQTPPLLCIVADNRLLCYYPLGKTPPPDEELACGQVFNKGILGNISYCIRSLVNWPSGGKFNIIRVCIFWWWFLGYSKG